MTTTADRYCDYCWEPMGDRDDHLCESCRAGRTEMLKTLPLGGEHFDLADSQFLFGIEHGNSLHAFTVTLNKDIAAVRTVTDEDVKKAFTTGHGTNRCHHEHDCCGCLVSRSVRLVQGNRYGYWLVIVEDQINV